MLFTTLRALAWSVHDELVHAQDCFARLLHSAWFDKKKGFTATLSSALREGIVRERKIERVLYLSRCVTARKFPQSKGGESHHDPAYRKSLAMHHIQWRTLEILSGTTLVMHWSYILFLSHTLPRISFVSGRFSGGVYAQCVPWARGRFLWRGLVHPPHLASCDRLPHSHPPPPLGSAQGELPRGHSVCK